MKMIDHNHFICHLILGTFTEYPFLFFVQKQKIFVQKLFKSSLFSFSHITASKRKVDGKVCTVLGSGIFLFELHLYVIHEFPDGILVVFLADKQDIVA